MNIQQKTAEEIRNNHGVELVPNEIEEMLTESYEMIRQHLRDHGHNPPESNAELRKLIRSAIQDIDILATAK